MGSGQVRLISLDRCEGEARESSRKGKLEVASFSDEHEEESEELVVDVILSSRHEKGSEMGALAKRLLINQLAVYVAELKSVYSNGSLLPSKDGSPPTLKPTVKHCPQT